MRLPIERSYCDWESPMNKAVAYLLIAALLCPQIALASEDVDAVKTKDMQLLKTKIGANKVLNVAFQDTDIEKVLKFFSEEYKLNIVSAQEVKGKVTFSFKDIHPIEAFNSMLAWQGFDWYEHHGSIHILAESPIHIIKLNYVSAQEVFDTFSKMLPQYGLMTINPFSNSVVLRLPGRSGPKFIRAIKELDQVPMQVLVEAKIMETGIDSSNRFGVDLKYTRNADSTAEIAGNALPATDQRPGLYVQVVTPELQAQLDALSSRSNIEILAFPKILVMNNKEAKIITGERLGYKVTTVTGSTAQETISFLEVGTKLLFRPNIASNGDIVIYIKPEVSEGAIVGGIPNETTTETSTQVVVRDGQTLLIGGLIRNKKVTSVTGVPILSSIPLIDIFFKKETTEIVKRELTVLLTPHLVTLDRH